MKTKYFLATNDVELTSIKFNKQRKQTGEAVMREGLPKLIELYKRYSVTATFFVTCDIATAFPDVVRQIVDNGHELASHSYTHSDDSALDILSYNKQLKLLKDSKRCLEDIGGTAVVSFRAPALRVNQFTPMALIDAGFLIDSSVASQRADMFFSFGAIKKFDRLFAPRKAYFTSETSLAKRGTSPLFEIPISAMLIPYIGTTLRIAPSLLSAIKCLLHWEAMITGKPINFLIHPNECFLEYDNDILGRRSTNYLTYLVAERLRSILKSRNLGEAIIDLYSNHLEFFAKQGYKFTSCIDYYDVINRYKI